MVAARAYHRPVFRRRRPSDDVLVVAELRTIEGVPMLVVPAGFLPEQRHPIVDLTMIRRLRGLDLDDDRWLFSFRPEGLVEVRGKPGGKLANRIRRARPDVVVHVHHPDDD